MSVCFKHETSAPEYWSFCVVRKNDGVEISGGKYFFMEMFFIYMMMDTI